MRINVRREVSGAVLGTIEVGDVVPNFIPVRTLTSGAVIDWHKIVTGVCADAVKDTYFEVCLYRTPWGEEEWAVRSDRNLDFWKHVKGFIKDGRA